MTHVLILVVLWKMGYAGTLVVSQQEYSSLASCQKAGKAANEMIAHVTDLRSSHFACVPK